MFLRILAAVAFCRFLASVAETQYPKMGKFVGKMSYKMNYKNSRNALKVMETINDGLLLKNCELILEPGVTPKEKEKEVDMYIYTVGLKRPNAESVGRMRGEICQCRKFVLRKINKLFKDRLRFVPGGERDPISPQSVPVSQNDTSGVNPDVEDSDTEVVTGNSTENSTTPLSESSLPQKENPKGEKRKVERHPKPRRWKKHQGRSVGDEEGSTDHKRRVRVARKPTKGLKSRDSGGNWTLGVQEDPVPPQLQEEPPENGRRKDFGWILREPIPLLNADLPGSYGHKIIVTGKKESYGASLNVTLVFKLSFMGKKVKDASRGTPSTPAPVILTQEEPEEEEEEEEEEEREVTDRPANGKPFMGSMIKQIFKLPS